jgi:hypothetical protein
MDINSTTTSVVSSTTTNLMFLEGLTTKLNGIYFVRKTLTNDVNSAY